MKILMIAGASSGVGKTIVTQAWIAAARRRGFSVQPYKVGPDFLDPGHLAQAAGRPCRNLDLWMMGKPGVRRALERAGSDYGVIEGAMGLFDGRGATEEGSGAQLAKEVGAPVLLVLDARSISRSAAAVAVGFDRFDPGLRLAGVILNRVGSTRHEELLRESMQAAGIPVLGAIPREDRLVIPERYLGLVPAGESPPARERMERLADLAEQRLDLDALFSIARSPQLPDCSPPARPERPDPDPAAGQDAVEPKASNTVEPKASNTRVRVAVARDEAFSFYYADNLELIEQAGAELAEFSPIRDGVLPPCDLLYLGGGYPELHAAALAANREMIDAIRKAIAGGLPVYAECGGLIYLARGVIDGEGRSHPLLDVLPTWARMLPRRKALGYREVRLKRDCLLGAAGTRLRGHEFHYSELAEEPVGPGIDRCYAILGEDGEEKRREGYRIASVLASYIHLHFGFHPEAACSLVRSARAPGGR